MFQWKLRNSRDFFQFWEVSDAERYWNRRFELLSYWLSQNPDVIQKKFKESSDELEAERSQPADKDDVRHLSTQIKKKQENYVQFLGKKIDTLTTEMAVLRNQHNEFSQKLNQWADSVNGQLRFTYAICKKADLFMKEKQSTDPFAVAPRMSPATQRSTDARGSSGDPFNPDSLH